MQKTGEAADEECRLGRHEGGMQKKEEIRHADSGRAKTSDYADHQ
jgi:hypothetical protein